VPAAELSEQISLAGKEASGTGCMKLMINGAMTIGTLDGANVEMLDAVGEDNMYIFGLTSAEVDDLWLKGYNCAEFYANNEKLRRIINALHMGFAGESFSEIANYLLMGQGIADPYMCLADFESYRTTHERAIMDYQNKDKWNRMSLLNVAACGYFAADRSINEYAANIWNIKRLTDK
jgi:starch phosphorylase